MKSQNKQYEAISTLLHLTNEDNFVRPAKNYRSQGEHLTAFHLTHQEKIKQQKMSASLAQYAQKNVRINNMRTEIIRRKESCEHNNKQSLKIHLENLVQNTQLQTKDIFKNRFPIQHSKQKYYPRYSRQKIRQIYQQQSANIFNKSLNKSQVLSLVRAKIAQKRKSSEIRKITIKKELPVYNHRIAIQHIKQSSKSHQKINSRYIQKMDNSSFMQGRNTTFLQGRRTTICLRQLLI